MEIFGVLPGLSQFLKLATAMGKSARFAVCSVNGQQMLTMEFLVGRMEQVAGDIVEERLLQSVYARTSDLMLILEREQASLEQIETMGPGERAAFATLLQTMGNTASQLEAELGILSWQALPALEVIGAVKNGAYALAYGLSAPGENKSKLRDRVLPAELAETRRMVAEKEADFTGFVVGDVTVRRESNDGRTASGKLCTNCTLTIDARATRGTGTLAHQQRWSCTRKLFRPRSCDNFGSRRAEYFGDAYDKHVEVRAEILEAFDEPYLGFRNKVDLYQGVPFFLINNLTRTGPAATRYTCLDVAAPSTTAPGGATVLGDCEFQAIDPATAAVTAPGTDQVWRFVRGSGLVQNVSSGLCLDVAGAPGQQADGARVVLARCDIQESPERADQQWGMNPLGYLVNLATGRCLDLNGDAATDKGATARVGPCEYGRSPKAGAVAASHGVTPGDPGTDQSWSLGYLGVDVGPLADQGVGRHPFLPAPPPSGTGSDPVSEPEPVDTTPPTVGIQTVTQRAGTTTAEALFSVDQTATIVECRVDRDAYVPCTSPHLTASLPTGGHTLTLRAVDAAGNTASAEMGFPIDADPPLATIDSGPSDSSTTIDRARFTFTSSEPGSVFECRLDDGPALPCTSPTDYGRLSAGRHTFTVRAIASNGVAQTSPVTRTWLVKQCVLHLGGAQCLLVV
ncbi:hypothetical protein ASD81_16110 [Nocardioides sp. Root614]|nr:hypothetical protein ASD81_16110 [Nocardioides sp. Root614]KRA87641.1 hypothetical protein ASD84_16385 [Nocardioides sp. Root682]